MVSQELPDTFVPKDDCFTVTMYPEAEKPMKEVVFITDPKLGAELDDSVRIHILHILRAGIDDTLTTESRDEETGDKIIRQREVKRHALSVIEIVKQSKESKKMEEITKNQVYHHLPKLVEHGFIIKFATVKRGERETTYYKRTSKGFVITSGVLATDKKMAKAKIEGFVERMCTVFALDLNEEQIAEFNELWVELYMAHAESRSKIGKLVKADVADKEVLKMYDTLVEIHSSGTPKVQEIYRKLRKILFSE